MHIVHRKIKELSRKERSNRKDESKKTELIDDVWYRFNMYCVSLLVNARTLHELDTILEDVVVCLSKKQTKNLTTAYRRLTGRIHNMENDCNINLADFQKEMKNVKIESDECNADHWGKSCNPFIEYFEKKVAALETNMAQSSIAQNDNRSHCPQFFIFLLKSGYRKCCYGLAFYWGDWNVTKQVRLKMEKENPLRLTSFSHFHPPTLNQRVTSKEQ